MKDIERYEDLRRRAQVQFDLYGCFTLDFASDLTQAGIEIDHMLAKCELLNLQAEEIANGR